MQEGNAEDTPRRTRPPEVVLKANNFLTAVGRARNGKVPYRMELAIRIVSALDPEIGNLLQYLHNTPGRKVNKSELKRLIGEIIVPRENAD